MTPRQDDPAGGAVQTGHHALVVADGDVPDRATLDSDWPGWDAGIDLVIAADAGFARARRLGLEPDRLVGDLDSLDPALLPGAIAGGLVVERSSADKDESDTELAVLAALRLGARRITILGALGGRRFDHTLANVGLLAHGDLSDTRTVLIDAGVRLSLLTADGSRPAVTASLPGQPGATISLLPLGGDVVGVTTSGLRYPLRDEPLPVGPARGLSNVREAPDASVTIRRGRLLIIESTIRD